MKRSSFTYDNAFYHSLLLLSFLARFTRKNTPSATHLPHQHLGVSPITSARIQRLTFGDVTYGSQRRIFKYTPSTMHDTPSLLNFKKLFKTKQFEYLPIFLEKYEAQMHFQLQTNLTHTLPSDLMHRIYVSRLH